MSEMNISFFPSYFSSSQHHVVNSFLILILNIHNLPMLHLSWLSSVLSSFLPLKDVFCHHHTTHSFLSPAPLSHSLSPRHFSYVRIFFSSLEAAERMLCVITVILGEEEGRWWRWGRERKGDIKMLSFSFCCCSTWYNSFLMILIFRDFVILSYFLPLPHVLIFPEYSRSEFSNGGGNTEEDLNVMFLWCNENHLNFRFFLLLF